MRRIGVDVGGTFTDIIYWDDAAGATAVHKTASTPHDPSVAVMTGIRELCQGAGIPPDTLDMFFHGTTVATNIVLEHKGAAVGLITTEGFRDVLHIARKKRPFNFSSYQDLPWQKHPLVRRRNRLPVPERVRATGEVERPLDLDAVRIAARRLRESGVEAVAVAFLFSFVNPDHEQAVLAVLAEEMPEAYVCASSDVAPQYREYERFSTTALNAYIGPKVSRYVANLAQAAEAQRIADDVHLMTSAGGVVTSRGAVQRPVSLLMSGVVAGLLAGCEVGAASGARSVITLDVGGTSADIGVAPDGKLRMKHLLDTKIGDYDAMVPMAEVDTIGAGGGSIASIDAGGMFRVGPRSAGADPGPVCYGRGGREPTATDAMVVLGWLRPENFLGGRLPIDADAARCSLASAICPALGASVEFAAMGTVQIVTQAMVDAVSLHSVRKGYDPREFALVPMGGAGPLFAWAVADQMQIPRVVVPRHPGITSAMGLLTTEIRYDEVATVWQDAASADHARIDGEYRRITDRAIRQLRSDGLDDADVGVERTADCRYLGQGYELRVPVPDGPVTNDWVEQTIEAFEAAHERTYFQRFPGTPVQIINVRVTGVGAIPRLHIPGMEPGDEDASPALKLTTRAWFAPSVGAEPVACDVQIYDRDLLRPNNALTGPAIVEQFDSTTVVGPGQRAAVDGVGHLVIEGSAA
jgi:N-methylhydantoinase A/oxoprolinase/acetone carboxylase beta subunit